MLSLGRAPVAGWYHLNPSFPCFEFGCYFPKLLPISWRSIWHIPVPHSAAMNIQTFVCSHVQRVTVIPSTQAASPELTGLWLLTHQLMKTEKRKRVQVGRGSGHRGALSTVSVSRIWGTGNQRVGRSKIILESSKPAGDFPH